jgi:hypothetical protein
MRLKTQPLTEALISHIQLYSEKKARKWTQKTDSSSHTSNSQAGEKCEGYA